MGHRRRSGRSRTAGDADVLFGCGVSQDSLKRERQLCREAFEAIGLALATLNDEAWSDVELVAVEPAPDASRLAVVVRASGATPPALVEQKLEQISGYLRSELASAIHRKRVPSLSYRVLSPRDEP
jgi:ribosome-binding factor A